MDTVLVRLQRELERDRLADCMLLLGPSRRRLRDLASRVATVLLQARGDVREHPDAVFFDPDALGVKGLQVAHIAERDGGQESVEAALRYKPLRGGRRVLLLFEVDRMNPDAQAALLKTSEEPPAETHLVLTAGDASPILPALLSRCRITRLPQPGVQELAQRAAAMGLEPAELEKLSQALGRAESALELSAADREQLLEQEREFRRWCADPAQTSEWLIPPDGTVGEQRHLLQIRFAACLGWLIADYPDASPIQVLRMDRLAIGLSDALADLAGQVSPALVCEHLALRVRSLGSCTA